MIPPAEGPGRQNHFAFGVGSVHFTSVAIREPYRASRFDEHPYPGGTGDDARNRMVWGEAATKVGAGGVGADTVVHVRVETTEAVLLVAVDVIGPWKACLLAGADERGIQRTQRLLHPDRDRTIATAIGIFATLAAFEPFVVGQHLRVSPTARAFLRPTLVVERVAAQKDGAVDRGGTAEGLAARLVNATVVEVALRGGGEMPVERAVRFVVRTHRPRHTNRPMQIRPTRFQQQHPVTGRGKPMGDDAASRAGADDDVVELFALHARRD